MDAITATVVGTGTGHSEENPAQEKGTLSPKRVKESWGVGKGGSPKVAGWGKKIGLELGGPMAQTRGTVPRKAERMEAGGRSAPFD